MQCTVLLLLLLGQTPLLMQLLQGKLLFLCTVPLSTYEIVNFAEVKAAQEVITAKQTKQQPPPQQT
jgi:hypothetical protein